MPRQIRVEGSISINKWASEDHSKEGQPKENFMKISRICKKEWLNPYQLKQYLLKNFFIKKIQSTLFINTKLSFISFKSDIKFVMDMSGNWTACIAKTGYIRYINHL